VLLGFETSVVKTAANGEEGSGTSSIARPSSHALDLALPAKSGIELLPQFKERQPDLPIIMITAYGTVDNVVEAIRAARKIIQKPWTTKAACRIRSAVARHRAERKTFSSAHPQAALQLLDIVGKTSACCASSTSWRRWRPAGSTILIQGESGTGKEVIAKGYHANSPRRDKPFVPINTGRHAVGAARVHALAT